MSKAFNNSIRKCINLLYDISFLYQVGSNQSLTASDDFKRASRRSIAYREVYDMGAKMQDFNFMLIDQSFFQFTEEVENKEIRLAYYPNPYKFIEYKQNRNDAQKMLDEGEITEEEFDQLISEEITSTDIPVIRYDLSLSQYCENYHPAAHLHIGFFSENRWPVNRKLTPLSFLFKILMYYYPDLWISAGDKGDENQNELDIQYRTEASSCEYLDNLFFSELESKRFYFT